MKSLTRLSVISVTGMLASALLLAAPFAAVRAEPPPIQELDSDSPAPALSAGGEMLLADAASKAEPAATYAVDYVNFARNLFLIGTVYFTLRYIGSVSPSKKKKRGSEPQKGGVGGLLFMVMLGLLATQALSFYLYSQEAGPPGRTHKTVPFGREYFVY